MDAFKSLSKSMKEELRKEGLKVLDEMVTVSQSQEYREFAEIIMKAEEERERTPEELGEIAFNIFVKKGGKLDGTVQK